VAGVGDERDVIGRVERRTRADRQDPLAQGRRANLLLVACGDSSLDNRKVKTELGGKARMLPPEEATALTGQPAGGVCPFDLATPLPVYFDVRLKAYDEVVPAAGSTHSAMRINPVRMAELVEAEWVDVCRDGPQPSARGRLPPEP
jgi:prolyl-tRNA editing enzyme YbaK/EbsC (Cys-tRNA(Pro) deacylase)